MADGVIKPFGGRTKRRWVNRRYRNILNADTGDVLFDNVSLLLSFTGTAGQGNADCTDLSSFEHTLTFDTAANISATDDAQNKDGYGQHYILDGNNDRWLAANAHASAFDIDGSTDFTIEWWSYKVGWNVIDYPFGCDGSYYVQVRRSTEDYRFKFERVTGGAATLIDVNVQTEWTLNDWVHIAISRADGVLKLFFDGQAVATVSDTSDLGGDAKFFVVGAANKINTGSISDMDDFRLTVGAARYTSNFTPSGPHPES